MEWLGCSSSCEYPQGFTIENYNDMKLLCNNIRNSHSFLVLVLSVDSLEQQETCIKIIWRSWR